MLYVISNKEPRLRQLANNVRYFET